MIRTSTRAVRPPPRRSTCPSCSTRSSFGWSSSGSSPISSRNTVPPFAVSNRPACDVWAPVNAPRSRPKSSLSMRVPGGRRNRRPRSCDGGGDFSGGWRGRRAPCPSPSRRGAAPSPWWPRRVRRETSRISRPRWCPQSTDRFPPPREPRDRLPSGKETGLLNPEPSA